MKYSTAKVILDKMMTGKEIKLRKSKFGGISEKTWNMLLDTVFWEYGLEKMQYLVVPESDNIKEHVIVSYRDKLISNKVFLY